MTLREIRATWPNLFYKQDWFGDEVFMAREADEVVDMPTFASCPVASDYDGTLFSAATLAGLYTAHWRDPIWRKYLWTSDLDSHAQRVYVGSNGKGLEIHRHIHITERFGVPVWP